MPPPEFMLKQPPPYSDIKRFFGRALPVYVGFVNYSDIKGWVKNPRIEHQVRQFKKDNGGRDPTDEEILEIMLKDKSHELKDIATDIHKNLVRTPVVVSYKGSLLDGNRRLFATRWLLRKENKLDVGLRGELEKIPCWVLGEKTTPEDERAVVVHENFNPSTKKEWERYLKARQVKEGADDDKTPEELMELYGWSKGRIKSELEAMELSELFIDRYKDELGEFEAEKMAIEFFTYFEQARTTFNKAIFEDDEFQGWFFDVLKQGRHGDNVTNVRKLHQVYKDSDAKAALMNPQVQPKDAIRNAIHIADEAAVGDQVAAAESKVARFSEWLEKLKIPEMDTVTAAQYDRLQSVVYARSRHFKDLDGERAIERFADWMERIGSKQVGTLTGDQIRRLQESVDRLRRQSGK